MEVISPCILIVENALFVEVLVNFVQLTLADQVKVLPRKVDVMQLFLKRLDRPSLLEEFAICSSTGGISSCSTCMSSL